MELDSRALNIIEILQSNGFQAVIVGGAIRDSVLGLTPKDYDISTNASSDEVCKLFPNNKIIGQVFQVTQIEYNGLVVEIARFRNEFNHDGRNCEVDFNATLEEDLSRRDLVINALAYNGNKIIDLYGGLDDLKDGIVRFVGNIENRINEDNLRILRAIRIGFKLFNNPIFDDNGLLNLNMYKIKSLSQERITSELLKIIDNMTWLHYSNNRRLILNMFSTILGIDFYNIVDYDQNNPHHNLTLDDHTIMTMVNCPKGDKFKLTALLHDLGKYNCAVLNETTGFTRYIGHEKFSVEIADKIMKNLKLPNKLQDEVKELISFHMVSLSDVHYRNLDYKTKWVNKKIYQLKHNSFNDLIDIAKSDKSGKPCEYEFIYEELKGVASEIYNSDKYLKSKSDLKIDKRRLVELLPNVELMKDLVDVLCLYVIKTGRNNEEDLINRTKQYIKNIKK